MIYLASPYSHPNPAVREMRFRTNCEVAARLMLDGHIVFSPIAHGHPISEFGVGTDCQTWNRLNRRQLAWCSELLVLTLGGWQESAGVRSEIRFLENFSNLRTTRRGTAYISQ